MQPLSQPSASLQTLLQGSGAVPDYLHVKAKGFKAMLRSLMEFLETYQVQAHIFAKLPVGNVWQADLLRYGQSLDSPHSIIRFVRRGGSATQLGPQDIQIALPDGDLWRGEYFVFLQSPSFALLMLAQRLQPLSTASALDISDDEEGDLTGGIEAHPQILASEGSPAPRSTYLAVCTSINPTLLATMEQVLHQQVQRWAETRPTGLAHPWEDYCPPVDTTAPAFLDMVDRWLMWQMRSQENLRQYVANYRQQALQMSTLTSQNEVLLNTLRLKDEFLNTVGQELRTPLTTIKTALTLLDSPQIKPPQRQRYMEMISQECDRQSSLISGVLNLLQIETSVGQTQLTPVMLAETVPPVVSTYQPLAEEKGVMLAYTIPNNLPKVACPDAWLRQIMIHLLNNSIKYTRNGGEVWVTAREVSDSVELEVRDTGLGISPADLPNIFDYFYRGRNLPADASEGAGLGLSIVQQLLMFCGGTIVVNSQPNQGTTFTVRVPLAET